MHFNISTRNIRTGYPGLQELETRNPKTILQRKTLPAPARSLRIGVIENKAFAVKAAAKLKYCAGKVQYAFLVYRYLYSIVFKNLIGVVYSLVKFQFV